MICFRSTLRFVIALSVTAPLLALGGCATQRDPHEPIPAPEAVKVTNADVENLLRIVIELRKEVSTLSQEIEKLKAKR